MKDNENQKKAKTSILPVTILGGFLGAGKTSLLKHILETKHQSSSGSFKCAVIVNDVAELNIDKSLLDQSALVQSEDVIAMQNGCVCCTLSGDLIAQVTTMASKNVFDYMIIEASGISETSALAQLFQKCDDDHDHDEAHQETVVLSDLARLDTCVTVVDAAEFFINFESVAKDENGTWSTLMVEQIEYANVIILNKTDLVSYPQIQKIMDHLSVLNNKAKILTSHNSAIDITEVVDTKMYNEKDFESPLVDFVEEKIKECCKSSMSRGESPCCRKARTIDSGLSKVMLTSKSLPETRHGSRFGITSFLYKARRPFHSSRFHEFCNKYFIVIDEEDEDEEEDEGEGEEQASEHNEDQVDSEMAEKVQNEEEIGEEKELSEEEMIKRFEEKIKQKQEEAAEKQKLRADKFGSVLRSKGYVWTVHTHDVMVVYGQAGNTVNLELGDSWQILDPRAWIGTEEEKTSFREGFKEHWGDRRQELVFIGHEMKHEVIQKTLDSCLLTDEEFALGMDGWKAIDDF